MNRETENNSIRMIFKNLPENEKISRTTAAVFAAETDPTMEELSDLKTVVSEAVTNAIIHAYPHGSGDIELYLKREGQTVYITVKDYGVGILDVARSMEPLYTTSEDQEHSGMGFTFMEAFSDSLDVTSEPGKGTVVKIIKVMGKEDEGGSDL